MCYLQQQDLETHFASSISGLILTWSICQRNSERKTQLRIACHSGWLILLLRLSLRISPECDIEIEIIYWFETRVRHRFYDWRLRSESPSRNSSRSARRGQKRGITTRLWAGRRSQNQSSSRWKIRNIHEDKGLDQIRRRIHCDLRIFSRRKFPEKQITEQSTGAHLWEEIVAGRCRRRVRWWISANSRIWVMII